MLIRAEIKAQTAKQNKKQEHHDNESWAEQPIFIFD
jgi:hypothetical protein